MQSNINIKYIIMETQAKSFIIKNLVEEWNNGWKHESFSIRPEEYGAILECSADLFRVYRFPDDSVITVVSGQTGDQVSII